MAVAKSQKPRCRDGSVQERIKATPSLHVMRLLCMILCSKNRCRDRVIVVFAYPV